MKKFDRLLIHLKTWQGKTKYRGIVKYMSSTYRNETKETVYIVSNRQFDSIEIREKDIIKNFGKIPIKEIIEKYPEYVI